MCQVGTAQGTLKRKLLNCVELQNTHTSSTSFSSYTIELSLKNPIYIEGVDQDHASFFLFFCLLDDTQR